MDPKNPEDKRRFRDIVKQHGTPGQAQFRRNKKSLCVAMDASIPRGFDPKLDEMCDEAVQLRQSAFETEAQICEYLVTRTGDKK